MSDPVPSRPPFPPLRLSGRSSGGRPSPRSAPPACLSASSAGSVGCMSGGSTPGGRTSASARSPDPPRRPRCPPRPCRGPEAVRATPRRQSASHPHLDAVRFPPPTHVWRNDTAPSGPCPGTGTPGRATGTGRRAGDSAGWSRLGFGGSPLTVSGASGSNITSPAGFGGLLPCDSITCRVVRT